MKVYLKIFYPSKKFISIPIFFTLLILIWWLPTQSLELFNFDKGIISIATINKIDISLRVLLYYKALFFGSFVFFLFTGICNIADKIFGNLSDQFFKILTVLASTGIFVIFFQFIKISGRFSISIIVVVILCALSYFIVSRFFKINDSNNHVSQFIWYICISFSVFFFVIQLFLFFSKNISIQLFYIFFFSSFLLIQINGLLLQKFSIDSIKYIYILQPLLFIPVLCFISNEFYLSLNQHAINILSPWKLYIYSLLGVIYFVIRNYKRVSNFTIERNLFTVAQPLILISIVLIFQYKDVIIQPKEMFELANPANGIMRFYEFGEIPIIQAFSSHFLSEQAFCYIYTFLNGYDGTLSFLIYNFFHFTVFVIIAYFFIYKLFDNAVFAFLFALFFPFLDNVIPSSHIMAIVSIFIIYKLFSNYSFHTMLYLLAWTTFLFIWKIDIGIANFVAVNSLLLIYFFISPHKKYIIHYFKSWLYIAVSVILLFIILTGLTDINIWENVQKALSYLGATQAHGYSKLTEIANKYYRYHYFIFPILTTAIFIYLLFQIKKYFQAKNISFIYISLLFLIIYYFANAQRGLVRHSLIEGEDMFISSFIFLILGLFSALFYIRKGGAKPIFIFTFIVVILINNFEVNSKRYNSLADNYRKASVLSILSKPSSERIKRVTVPDSEYIKQDILPFKNFMEKHFKKESTFIDFSNTPMLYFYTKKIVPSYFNQYMQNTVTPYLQAKNIINLSRFDIPVVVFSNYPPTYWDNTDGVPNSLRYNIIAEYIYNNYEPYGIIGKHYIWLKKGLSIKDRPDVDSNFVYGPKKGVLKKLPYIIGMYDKLSKSNTIELWNSVSFTPNNILLSVDLNSSLKGNYLRIDITNNGAESSAILKYGRNHLIGGEVDFDVLPKSATYDIPLSWQYNWSRQSQDFIQINFSNPSAIKLDTVAMLKKIFRD